MKAAILHAADSVPVYGDFDDPVAGEASEIVELVAPGIHPLTRLVATGRHYSRGAVFPLIPGLNAVARTPKPKPWPRPSTATPSAWSSTSCGAPSPRPPSRP